MASKTSTELSQMRNIAKQDDEHVEVARQERVRRSIMLIQVHQCVNILISLTVEPTRIHLLRRLEPNADAAMLGARLTTWTAINGFCEFIVNPTVGRLCDAYGRRPCFMISPAASLVLKTLFVLRPSPWLLGAEAVMCDGTRVISGATCCTAALSDLLSGQELAAAFSTQLAVSGFSVMVGPLIGSALISRTGSLYAPFVAAAAMAGGMLLGDYLFIEETLGSEKRKPFAGVANPLNMSNIFLSGDASLTTLVSSCALNFALEPKNLSVLNTMHNMQTLGMQQTGMGYMKSMTGLGMLVQSPISSACKQLGIGALGFRSLANFCSAASYGLKAAVPRIWAAWTASFVAFIGEGRQSTNKALAIGQAAKAGIGKGEFNGQFANLRALIAVLAPVAYGRCYEAALRRKKPSLSFIAPMVVAFLTELICRRQLASQQK